MTRRAITLSWDPDDTAGIIDVALGEHVSVAEAHHVLATATDDAECLCPGSRITRHGVELTLEADGDEDE